MKRIISLFICLNVLLSLFSLPIAVNAEDDIDLINHNMRVQFIEALGIEIDEILKGDIYDFVNRGQAAAIIANLIKCNYESNDLIGVFSDVDEKHEYVKQIETLAQLGIIHGYTDKTYKPDNDMKIEDLTMLYIRLAGHHIRMEVGENASNIASELDLFKNVKSIAGEISILDFVTITYNVLHAKVYELNLTSADNFILQETNMTLMEELYDVRYHEGIITKTDVTTLWSASDIQDNELVVSGKNGEITVFAPESDGFREDLGKNIGIYYIDGEDEKTYVYHYVLSRNNIVNLDFLSIDFSESTIENRKIYYYDKESNKNKTIELADDFSFIYNYMYYGEAAFDFSSLDGKSGLMTAIDNNTDGKIDVLKIIVYDIYFIQNIGIDEDILYDKIVPGRNISLLSEEYTRMYIYDTAGKEMNVSELSKDMVLSVAMNSPSTKEKVIEIIVSDKSINGKIMSVNRNGLYTDINIDGMQDYCVLNCAMTNIAFGKYIIAYLDKFGNIIYIKSDIERGWQYGVMIDHKHIESDDEGNQNLSFKIIGIDGAIHQFFPDEKIKIDGYKYTRNQYDQANGNLNTVPYLKFSGNIEGVFVIKYNLDKNGYISEIDTVNVGENEDKNSTLREIEHGTLNNLNNALLGNKSPVQKTTSVLAFDDAYSYTESSDLNDESRIISGDFNTCFGWSGEEYDCATYVSSSDAFYAEFVVGVTRKRFNDIDYMPLFVFEEVYEFYDDYNCEVLNAVEGYFRGEKNTFYAKGDILTKIKTLNKGDVIKFCFDQKNNIVSTNYAVIYSPLNRPTPIKPTEITTTNVYSGYFGGKLVDIRDGYCIFEANGDEIMQVPSYDVKYTLVDLNKRGDDIIRSVKVEELVGGRYIGTGKNVYAVVKNQSGLMYDVIVYVNSI